MGYYTRHTLTIFDCADTSEIQEYINNNDDMEYALGDDFGESSDSCKWYDYQEDMKTMSATFPSILFLLEGKGEEAGDVWKEYYLNGKFQRCQAKLVFDEFDENKLE